MGASWNIWPPRLQTEARGPPKNHCLEMVTTLAFWSPEGHFHCKNTVFLKAQDERGQPGPLSTKKVRQSQAKSLFLKLEESDEKSEFEEQETTISRSRYLTTLEAC